VLVRLYPDQDDLAPARRRLTLFLAQYWGGPTTYSDERGHPRLRMRHFPFEIGPAERDRWLVHMQAAIDGLDPQPEVREALERYFGMAAESLRNQD
jgi:hemoglobin